MASAIAACYDCSTLDLAADIGGGQGALLSAILNANPETRGILFDHPRVISDAAGLRLAGVADRCEVVAGDFFASAPAGARAYVLKNVITDWDDLNAVKILQTCRAAMTGPAKLLVVEPVVQPTSEPDPVKMSDLRMLVMTGGRARTAAESQQLYKDAGFKLTNIMPTRSVFKIIVGIRRS